ncbi:hypothetical protein [Salibacterium halotolerans]|uniref:Phage-related protein n=1 Tax=Salibacterium halotolerans TaxID=1884432 RepID=A0A1I5UV06_9BACI|nr:hypothetical protein [Salibacterium halotolerans]SFP99040.1 Phage-related protein [Salibacterium halotolerans]
MAYDLTAHLRLRDDMSGKIRNAAKQAKKANKEISGLGDALGFTADASADFRRKMTLATGAITAVPATVGPATVALGGLASSFSAAGAGAVGFGAVATSAIGGVIEKQEQIAELEKEIANASSSSARADAQAELQKAMEGVTGAQQNAITKLTEFKSWWGDFVAGFEEPVLRTFNESLTLIQKTMEGIKPAISTTSQILGDFLARVNRSFQTDQVQSFFDYINNNVGQGLNTILSSAGNLFVGFMEILKAFAPVSNDVGNGLTNLTEKFRSWAEGLAGSNGFKSFIDYARKNGPVLMDTIGNIVGFVGKLLTALAPLSTTVLNLASSFAEWLNTSKTAKQGLDMLSDAGTFLKNNMSAVKTVVLGVISAIAGIKIISTITSIVSAGVAIFRTLKTVLMAVRGAMLFVNMAMRANPIGAIITLISGLVMAGIYLWRNWDEGRAAVKKLWSAIKSAFTSIWNKTKTIWNNVKEAVGSALKSAGTAVSNFFDPLLGFIRDVKGAWQDFTGMLSNFSMPDLGGIASAAGNLFGGGGEQADRHAFHGMNRIPRNNFHAALHKGEMIVPHQQAKVLRDHGLNNVTSALSDRQQPAESGFDDTPYQPVSAGGRSQASGVAASATAGRVSGGKSGGQSAHAGTGGDVIFSGDMYVRNDSDIDKLSKQIALELRESQGAGA